MFTGPHAAHEYAEIIERLKEWYKERHEEHLEKGSSVGAQGYDEAIAACDQAIHLDPNNAKNYTHKGAVLAGLARFNEAIVAYDQAIHLDPNNAIAYRGKALALSYLGRYLEAIAACDQAIRLDPNDDMNHTLKDMLLYERAQRIQT